MQSVMLMLDKAAVLTRSHLHAQTPGLGHHAAIVVVVVVHTIVAVAAPGFCPEPSLQSLVDVFQVPGRR